MSDLKKAFQKLNKEKMSEDKKQLIFDRIMEEQSKSKSRKSFYTIAATAAAAFVIAAGAFIMPGVLNSRQEADEIVVLPQPSQKVFEETFGILSEPQVVSTVVMSLNPVVKFGLDANGEVLEVVGMDEDGEQLLRGIDCEGLSFENAAIVVVNQLLLKDYINSGVEFEEITVSVESEQMNINSLDVVTETIKTAAEQHKIDVNVTSSEETQQLSIVLTGEEVNQADEGETDNIGQVTVEFVLSDDYTNVVDDVNAFAEDDESLITEVDFAGMPFKEAVLYSINELIELGYINDQNDSRILLNLNTLDETKRANLKYLTELLVMQAGLKLDIVQNDETGELELVASETADTIEEPTFTMSQILDRTVHKTKEGLTKTQKDILGFVYTPEQIDELLAIRYWVVVPNLVGMEESKAAQMLQQMGIVPVVTREYNDQYAGKFSEGTVVSQDFSAGTMLEKGDRFALFVLDDKPCPLGEGWTPSVYDNLNMGETVGFASEYEKYISGTNKIYSVISNTSKENVLEYDTDVALERFYEGEWYSAVCSDCFEPTIRTLAPLETVGEKIQFKFAENLEDGHYRIVKQIGEGFYSAEFDIGQGGYDERLLSGYVPIEDLEDEYTAELAKANGDFMIDNALAVHNQDKLINFFEKAGRKIPCMVRKTMFTTEGDAIVEDIIYNGEYFIVKSDTTRDEFGTQEVKKHIYSYIMLGYYGGKTNVVLANTFDRIPLDNEDENTDSYVILHDTMVIESTQIEPVVEVLMDEDAPLKVYSPDGKKYVSYTDGKKTVDFEVDASEMHNAGGIVFPEDRGEVAELIALEWRDENVVVITYTTLDESYQRIAWDVISEDWAELTEEEQIGDKTIEEDYFTSTDKAKMIEQFVDEADEFSLSLADENGTRTYSVSKTEATLGIDGNEQPTSVEWNEEKWNAFVAEVVSCNVLDWKRVYQGEITEQMNEWTLRVTSERLAVISFGSGAASDEHEQLISVVKKYFETQDSQ